MIIQADNQVRLGLINESYALSIFEMVNQNRAYLRQWLSFVDKMETVVFAENFVQGTMQCNQAGMEYAFVIMQENKAVGRIGVYKIDRQNNIVEIGYWLIESAQGKGIITIACKAMIRICFEDILLNRIEIKCGTDNNKSQAIPINLGFTPEGTIMQGELLHDKYVDLYLYSLLLSEYKLEK